MACLCDTSKPEQSWWTGGTGQLICTDCNFWDCVANGCFWHPSPCFAWLLVGGSFVVDGYDCPWENEGNDGSCCTNNSPSDPFDTECHCQNYGLDDKFNEQDCNNWCKRSPNPERCQSVWIPNDAYQGGDCGCECMCDAICDDYDWEKALQPPPTPPKIKKILKLYEDKCQEKFWGIEGCGEEIPENKTTMGDGLKSIQQNTFHAKPCACVNYSDHNNPWCIDTLDIYCTGPDEFCVGTSCADWDSKSFKKGNRISNPNPGPAP